MVQMTAVFNKVFELFTMPIDVLGIGEVNLLTIALFSTFVSLLFAWGRST
jgi:hypothetical protein